MKNQKILSEHMNLHDTVKNNQSHGIWRKTQIIGGYDLKKDERGISFLGEKIFETTNMVPLIGVEYVMEQIYGVHSPITPPTLNAKMGIGSSATITPPSSEIYPNGHHVCLFGLGTGGAAENNITALDEHYSVTNIPDMVPLRYTNDTLPASEANKYYGKKAVDGTIAYYLKRFDSDVAIHNLYKNGEDEGDGSEVPSSYLDSDIVTGVETFAEAVFSISKKDLREWFTYLGNVDESRFNSVGLYSAVYDSAAKDYSQIQLFSYLNIPTEPMALLKDLTIIYRVYGA